MSNAVAATLERIEDTYVLCAEGVPLFDAHDEPVSETEAKRRPAWVRKSGDRHVRRFDRAALEEIADNCNARDEAGDPCLFGAGHTVPDQYDDDDNLVRKVPEHEQPAPWGVFRNFRVEDVGGKAHLVADQYAHPDHAADVGTYPRRSVELWLRDRDIDYVAILRRRGKRDLGVVMHDRGSRRGDVLRYAMDEPGIDQGDIPEPGPDAPVPDPDAPDEEAYRQFMRCMKRYESEQAMPPPPAADVPPPGGGAPPVPGGDMPPPGGPPMPFGRKDSPQQYEKRVKALETQLAAERAEKQMLQYERELKALRDEGFELDLDAEKAEVKDFSPQQFGRHLQRIRRSYRQAPIGDTLVDTAGPGPDRDRGPDVISNGHRDKALTYMRKHGCEWDEAVDKTRGA